MRGPVTEGGLHIRIEGAQIPDGGAGLLLEACERQQSPCDASRTLCVSVARLQGTSSHEHAFEMNISFD